MRTNDARAFGTHPSHGNRNGGHALEREELGSDGNSQRRMNWVFSVIGRHRTSCTCIDRYIDFCWGLQSFLLSKSSWEGMLVPHCSPTVHRLYATSPSRWFPMPVGIDAFALPSSSLHLCHDASMAFRPSEVLFFRTDYSARWSWTICNTLSSNFYCSCRFLTSASLQRRLLS
ncbi:hypothetical protein BJV77DRAFT_394650 [Russula vinacea]|nr:hypothetical protein BJV77DRAFT_394650 [Russula vinacea]